MNVSGQLHVLVTLPQGNNFLYPMNRKQGGPESQSQHFGEDKNILPLIGIETKTIKLVYNYTN
jgi:hypothetical protein